MTIIHVTNTYVKNKVNLFNKTIKNIILNYFLMKHYMIGTMIGIHLG